MGFDCGFDIFPPLKPTELNQEKYERFVRMILEKYGSDDEHGGPTPVEQDRVARIVLLPKGAYIVFEVGEHPMLPYAPDMCNYFLRFSSSVSGRSTVRAKPYIDGVTLIAKQVFGSRVEWWHEQLDADDRRMIHGYYDWAQIQAAKAKMMIMLNGTGNLDAAKTVLVTELNDAETSEDEPE